MEQKINVCVPYNLEEAGHRPVAYVPSSLMKKLRQNSGSKTFGYQNKCFYMIIL